MAWQDWFTAAVGPGLFAGITLRDWLKMLRRHRFQVQPSRFLRLASITASSMANSFYGRIETWRFGRRIAEQTIERPLFILGHWRSGTTHLHNLLSRDQRFGAPNLYQVLYPRSFLTTEAVQTRLMSIFVPETRFGIDNVRISWQTPYEDEFAIAALSFCSPYVTMAFPQGRWHYDRFLTLREVPPIAIDAWTRALKLFMRKLTLKYQRPLVLKSPPHTCRIKRLLQIFPDARFVHIRRHPLAVYQSMQRMISLTLRYWTLQNPKCVDWDRRVVQQYQQMYAAYFEELPLIPDGQFHDICFEDLERDPVEQLRQAYATLDLPDFSEFEPTLRAYLSSLKGYEKNKFPDVRSDVQQHLAREWQECFERWGYSIGS